MKRNKGSFLVEAIVVCSIATIITLSVVSVIRLSIYMVVESRDSLAVERARETALSCLSSGGPPPQNYSSNITIVSCSGSEHENTFVYKITCRTFKGVKESFVVWPYK